MLGRGRRAPADPVESARLRREREALEKLRREVGERLQEVQRREAALLKRVAELDAREPAPAEPEPSVAQLEELDRRSDDLRAREQALDDREKLLADREAIVDRPATLDRVLADIEKRHAELAQAEQLFLRTRQELVERGDAIAQREEELQRWEREIAASGGPPITLPPVEEDGDAAPRRRTPTLAGFSSGLRHLERHGARRSPRP